MKKALKGYSLRNFVWKEAVFAETFYIFGLLVLIKIVSYIDLLQFWYKIIENPSFKNIVRQALLLHKDSLKKEELIEKKRPYIILKQYNRDNTWYIIGKRLWAAQLNEVLFPFMVWSVWKIAISLKHQINIFVLYLFKEYLKLNVFQARNRY